MRFALLAALGLAVLAGCNGREPHPEAPAERLPSRLSGLARLCENAAADTSLAVHCPSWLPRGAWGGRRLRSGTCEYLFDLNRRSAGGGGPYHALVGGRCGNFSLAARSGRWPAKARRFRDLGLIGSKPQAPGQQGSYFAPERLHVLRRTRVGERPGLLLMAKPFPTGGVHGGHIAAVWNQGAGYALTVHFADEGTPDDRTENMVLRAAASMSRYTAGEAP